MAWRRRCCALVLCLIGGTILTVVIAWGLAFAPVRWTTHSLQDPPGVDLGWDGSRYVVHHESLIGPGISRRALWSSHISAFPAAALSAFPPVRMGDPAPLHLSLTAWGPIGTTDWSTVERPTPSLLQDARGWPALALWCELDFDDGWTAPGGIMLTPDRTRHEDAQIRALPLRPILAGFAFNTVFYGAILYGLPVVLRLLRRLGRQGRCRECGYDLRDLPTCPECGAPAARPSRHARLSG